MIAYWIGTDSEKKRKRASPRDLRKMSPVTNRGRPGRNPSPRVSNEQHSLHSSVSMKEEVASPISAPNTPQPVRKQNSYETIENAIPACTPRLKVPKVNHFGPALRQIRVRDQVNQLDLELDRKLRDRKLIGQVKTIHSSDKIQIKLRNVNFRWHRGIKVSIFFGFLKLFLHEKI